MDLIQIGIMQDTVELHSLILVYVTLTLIQGHRSVGKQELLHQSHKVFNWFELNLVYCWDWLVWWTSYLFHLVHLIFKGGRTPLFIYWIKSLLSRLNLIPFTVHMFVVSLSLPSPLWLALGKMISWGRYRGGRRVSSENSFHSPTVISPLALDKPSFMKRYHRQQTKRWALTAHSPTRLTLHYTQFVSADGGMTVGLWRLPSLGSHQPPWYWPLDSMQFLRENHHVLSAMPDSRTRSLCGEKSTMHMVFACWLFA